jgi:ABC-2 type transport system ATP-binding protein/lipopolysaccharide transport system ATP-binding protein
MLELGAGFHPELTGRENVFLNGTILGHPLREIEGHMDEIIEFSELRTFIESPLRTYSSGMHARLGFAASTSWEPDILILDEVLSVGDESFRRKCKTRMKEFRNGKTTTILVSHSMNNIRSLCERVAWLDHGKILAVGPVNEVIAEYRRGRAGA